MPWGNPRARWTLAISCRKRPDRPGRRSLVRGRSTHNREAPDDPGAGRAGSGVSSGLRLGAHRFARGVMPSVSEESLTRRGESQNRDPSLKLGVTMGHRSTGIRITRPAVERSLTQRRRILAARRLAEREDLQQILPASPPTAGNVDGSPPGCDRRAASARREQPDNSARARRSGRPRSEASRRSDRSPRSPRTASRSFVTSGRGSRPGRSRS